MTQNTELKIVGFSVVTKTYDYQFGSHQVWSVMEYGVEGARAEAQEHVDFMERNFPEREARLLPLWA